MSEGAHGQLPPDSSSHSTVLAELVTRPLEDIAREMADLRTEKENLTRNVARMTALMPELELLRKESPVLRSAIKTFVRQTEFVPAMQYRAPPGLPSDVVRMVLKEAIGPPYEHNPQLRLGPRSAWMDSLRFRKNLTLVCRYWWEPATSIFYEHITLRRMGQVSALLDTLMHSKLSSTLGSYVKSIALFDFVVLPRCADMVREDMRALQRMCTTLRSFSFTEHENISLPPQGEHHSDFDSFWMPVALSRGVLQERAASTLRELELSMHWDSGALSDLHHFLASTTHLSSLKLEHVGKEIATPIPIPESDNAQPVSLCALKDLHMDGAFILYATSMWHVVQLKALAIEQCPYATDFVCRHGQRLTYLHIYEGKVVSNYSIDLPSIFSQCQLLEHFVGPDFETVMDGLLSASSPLVHLQHIDVLYYDTISNRNDWELLMTWLEEEVVAPEYEHLVPPALTNHNIRLIPYKDAPALLGLCDVPRILHPAALLDADHVRFATLRGQPWVQTSWIIRPNIDFKAVEYWRMSRGSPEEDDSEGSSYEPGEHEEDGDRASSSWKSTDDSDVGSSAGSMYDGGSEGAGSESEDLAEEVHALKEEPGQMDFQLDRETVLAAFRRSQDVDYLLSD